jgi:hypothetical protein
MRHTCIICGEKFQLSKTEINLIRNKEVKASDIVICDNCVDAAYNVAETEEYLRGVFKLSIR